LLLLVNNACDSFDDAARRLCVLRARHGAGGARERNKSLHEIGGKTKDEKFKSEQVEGAA